MGLAETRRIALCSSSAMIGVIRVSNSRMLSAPTTNSAFGPSFPLMYTKTLSAISSHALRSGSLAGATLAMAHLLSDSCAGVTVAVRGLTLRRPAAARHRLGVGPAAIGPRRLRSGGSADRRDGARAATRHPA